MKIQSKSSWFKNALNHCACLQREATKVWAAGARRWMNLKIPYHAGTSTRVQTGGSPELASHPAPGSLRDQNQEVYQPNEQKIFLWDVKTTITPLYIISLLLLLWNGKQNKERQRRLCCLLHKNIKGDRKSGARPVHTLHWYQITSTCVVR